ncbi:globin [Corynebacterium pelargi]|uniref:Group 2 truncated hemoglobin GlbO n=1 Tax=Corynebacterium pelargi TaxID=1471400 RepID=A0A410W7H0_9CORY|nr:globin [Corynebacterium pelargi]QAU51817.1 Group 2 truncated hemoglobin GlbO [Corynebacterium pelargi]GGG72289.1 hemin receptor [Corynebacterium pelargi]
MNDESVYQSIGGEATFRDVVHRFYQSVRNDDIIGPMYPEDDWEGAEDRLRMFLAQYWGGPSDYSQQRGHPRLRMRHAHFRIDAKAAQRWLELMDEAIDTTDIAPPQREALREHMQRVAYMLINTAG